jgi:outer membrane protein
MNPLVRIFLLLPIFAFSLTNSNAQEGWSLEQCIGYAIENNIQVKQQELSIKINENTFTQSKYSHLPNLNASASHNYNFGRAIDYGSNTVSNDLSSSGLTVSSSVALFNGFQITNTRKREFIDLQASISDIEKLKNSISLNIASAYLQILFYEELVETNRKQVELSKLQKERTSILVNAGSLPEGNIYEIEAQLASDELQLVNAQNQLEMAYLLLVQMLDLKSAENFRIQKPNLQGFDETIPTDSPVSLFEQSQQFLPQIKSAQLRVSSAEKGFAIAKGGYFPRLSLSGTYNSGVRMFLKEPASLTNEPFMDQFKQNASYTVGLSLTIPIFNAMQVRTSVSTAHINTDLARLNLENEKNVLFKEIQQAFTDASAALKKYQATTKSLSALQESFRYTEQKFGLGMVTTLDYTTAKTRLAKAETELLQSKYDFIFKTKILDFYKGNPIKL